VRQRIHMCDTTYTSGCCWHVNHSPHPTLKKPQNNLQTHFPHPSTPSTCRTPSTCVTRCFHKCDMTHSCGMTAKSWRNALQHTPAHCHALPHPATHCNALQRTATHCHTTRHCNMLQHSATHVLVQMPQRCMYIPTYAH